MRKAQTLGRHGWTVPIKDAPEEPKRASGRKDTKRWCLGRVGREHRKEWIVNQRYNSWNRNPDHRWWTETCASCRKEFRYCTGGLRFGRFAGSCICGHHAPR